MQPGDSIEVIIERRSRNSAPGSLHIFGYPQNIIHVNSEQG